MENCTLASAMLFKNSKELLVRSNENIKSLKFSVFNLVLVAWYLLLLTRFSHAEIFDRVVAFVDDHAITLSELQEHYENAIKLSPDITREEVLDTIINRKLLLREAKKYRIEAPSEEEIINEYIDLKLRAFIRTREVEMEEFYMQNVDQFKGKDYEDVREEIENYFTEKELNEKLKEVLKEFRKNSYIRIQLSND